MTDKEVWRDCPSYPGLMASSHGRVMRRVVGANGSRPRIIDGCVNAQGYLVSITTIWGGPKNIKLHALVCDAFHGPRPSEWAVVRHLDGCKTNNRPINLTWGTPAENSADTVRLGRQTRGSAINTARLTPSDLIEIKAMKSRGMNGERISKHFGVARSTINSFLRGQTWKSVNT